MPKDGTPTREKILAESRALVLQNGFSGTSIDQILEKTGITKGAFFYHFKNKNVLAQALIEDFAREDRENKAAALEHSKPYINNPKERLLAFIQLFIDMMSGLEEPYPGCLYISYTYEPNQFDEEAKKVIKDIILEWRETLEMLLNDVHKTLEAKPTVDIKSLADNFNVIFEGAFVVSRALEDNELIADQLKHYKNYIKLLIQSEFRI
ncbi:TetR/AcrR family transcriptional regulator [Fulvivirga lutea]|uniref:TetR/AcrR family transcriptional regulator n=1 Tax=Fulvivirga lutea TaxID=2810512 RepID=A0A974WFI4_9BACT|nr:TetR/AcrR family transcriptional regulator [Fulvivirga lutea]QSE97035.1 TetR/AcrR family transcriptional regulator [Fulvivirga lutea]